ncbi:MAG TPA: DUF6448 family protein [Anaerolineales bacterium]|nr:DUF6448 family protein [Anaerolineales bacterium]
MPPHCDTLDGPVVTAAKKALEARNVDLILPYVPKKDEAEIIRSFEKVMKIRKDEGAREIADLYFFETVVRVHRMGEGASYTGLKPAGLNEGPVIPVAEKALESGSPDELINIISEMVREQVTHRLHHVMHLKEYASQSVDAAREYVEAMLGLQVWAHAIHERIHGEAHAGHEHAHG